MLPVRSFRSTKLESFYEIQKLFKGNWSIMSEQHWFYRKWGLNQETPMDEVYERLAALEDKVKRLEEENVETSNELYRMENSLDARIDIIVEHCKIDQNV
jgi:hypothetical protein